MPDVQLRRSQSKESSREQSRHWVISLWYSYLLSRIGCFGTAILAQPLGGQADLSECPNAPPVVPPETAGLYSNIMARNSYVPHRVVLYGLLWTMAVVELGLTAYRINYTNDNFDTYDPIIVQLLVTSILTITWIPLILLSLRGILGPSRKRLGFLHGESARNLILWIMWLVGGAIATHKWPKRSLAGPGKQGRILTTIIAFAWIEFGLFTLVKVFAAMEYAAKNASGGGAGGLGPTHAREKPANSAAGTAPAENV
ncbi:hypothetical protein ACEPAF_9310 [Sanghuangporus sanghuang]